MKTRFATIAECAGPFRVTVWEQDDEFSSRPVEWHESLEPLDEGIQVWSFDDATSADVRSPFNPSGYPILDADGAPLWEGCEVEFVRRTTSINRDSGSGVVKALHANGGITVESDQPMPVYDRGFCIGQNRELYLSSYDYASDGPLKGAIVLKDLIGDRFEQGQYEVSVRLKSDPRSACTWMGPTERPPKP